MPRRIPRYIPADELARLMTAVASLPCPHQRAALLVARWSGARRGEICRLAVVSLIFGEGCLAGQPLRMATAFAITECSITRLEKSAMIAVLQDEPAFSKLFISYLLTRNISWISFSIRAKNAWRGFFYCWPTSERRED
jgi:integrase